MLFFPTNSSIYRLVSSHCCSNSEVKLAESWLFTESRVVSPDFIILYLEVSSESKFLSKTLTNVPLSSEHVTKSLKVWVLLPTSTAWISEHSGLNLN